MLLKLDGRGWQLTRSGACLDGNCKPPLRARGEFWTNQWLRQLKSDSVCMAGLRQMLSMEFCGQSVHRASDDQVIDRAVQLLTSGFWHLHSADPKRAGAESNRGWKRVPGIASAQEPSRWSWPIRTSFGKCLIVRGADLAAGEEFLENAFSLLEISQLTRGVEARRALPEIHEALHGRRPTASDSSNLSSMAQSIESAFRNGSLVVVRERARVGGGGAGGDEAAPASKPTASEAGAKSGSSRGSTPAFSPASQTAVEKTWFRMQLLDEDGQAIAGEDYVVVDSAGTRRQGKLDDNGELYIPPILPVGECSITFPNIHLNPRKRKR